VLVVGSLTAAGCSEDPGEQVPAGDTTECYDEPVSEPAFGDEDLTFHVGPYLGHTTPSSVAVSWETLEPGDTRLEYGPDDSYGASLEGESGTMHQLVLEGLEPDTTYHYRACTDERCTGDLHFTTAPPAGYPVRFSVYGDCQDNPDIHERVTEQIMADRSHLALVVGDLVSDGNFREQYKETFLDPARRLSHFIPRYAAVGNHDIKDLYTEHFRDYVMYPDDQGAPLAETNYTFLRGSVFFLVVDTAFGNGDLFFPVADYKPPLSQWIEEQIASPEARGARWRFAFSHYPFGSNCKQDDEEHDLSEAKVREYLLPLLWQAGFHGYFNGHRHLYERQDFDGRMVITTAGGGGGLDDIALCDDGVPEARYQRSVHHHVTVDTACDEAEVWARDIDGNVIERLRLLPDGSYEVIQSGG
jgi:3',5'-cyclic AMP phosphodiesterase CpdA